MSEEQTIDGAAAETSLAQVEAVPTDITKPDKITEAITKLGAQHKMTSIENASDYDQAKGGLVIWRGLRKMVKERHKDAKADILEKGRELDGYKTQLLKAIDDQEKPLLQLRHDYDDKKKAEKEAKEKAERERILKIDQAINQLRKVSTQRFTSSAQVTEAMNELAEFTINEELFEEKLDNAVLARDETINELEVILKDKLHDEQREKDLAEQKADQAVEAKKLAKEREQLDAEKAERDRIDLIDAAIKAIGVPATAPFESLELLQEAIEDLTAYEPDEATYQEKLPHACEARIETLKWLDNAKARLEHEKAAQTKRDAAQKKLDDDRAEFEAEKQKDADAKAAKEKIEREAEKARVEKIRLRIKKLAGQLPIIWSLDEIFKYEQTMDQLPAHSLDKDLFGEFHDEAVAAYAEQKKKVATRLENARAELQKVEAMKPDKAKIKLYASAVRKAAFGVERPELNDKELQSQLGLAGAALNGVLSGMEALAE